jgi:hypothetical protein
MENTLREKIRGAVKILYDGFAGDELIQVHETRKDFKGFQRLLLKRQLKRLAIIWHLLSLP